MSQKRLPAFLHFLHKTVTLALFCIATLVVGGCTNPNVQAFTVRDSFMEPLLSERDVVQVDFGAYENTDPALGDIVLIDVQDTGRLLVTRLIGLPGDTIELQDGTVFINGQALDEPYVEHQALPDPDFLWEPGVDEFVVLGDYRTYSLDSRHIGSVRRDQILGKVLLPN